MYIFIMKTSVITEDVVRQEDNDITERNIAPSAVPMLDENPPYAENTSYICDDDDASYIGDDEDEDDDDDDSEATKKFATSNSKQGNECDDETELDVYYYGDLRSFFSVHFPPLSIDL